MRCPLSIETCEGGWGEVRLFGRCLFRFARNANYIRRFDGLTKDQMKDALKWLFREHNGGYELDLENPKTLNEKINWLKLNYRNPLVTVCSDKCEMRGYVESKLGRDYLVPLLGVYESVDEVDFAHLPDRFVMKVNWGSGQDIVCTDRKALDIGAAKEKLRRWLRPESNHYFNLFEWGYKDIKPRIVIEEYIEGLDGLPDYKIFCYNGNARNLFVAQDRAKGAQHLRFTFFDREFNRLPFMQHYPVAVHDPRRPGCLPEMLEIAEKLAAPFPFCRVDMYVDRTGAVKVGELTFYHFSGMEPFDPPEWDRKLGDMLELPTVS